MKEGRAMISGIILASGFSRRMKREKLILPIGGVPMLERVICAAMASDLDEVLLVYNKEEIRALGERHGLSLVYNAHPENGQSAAVKAGVNHANQASIGFMFLVGDQPFVSADTINRLISVFNTEKSRIVAPVYGTQRGNPVIFPSALKQDLLALEGDQGGRAIMDQMQSLIRLVAIQDEREATDIDSVENYQRLIGSDA
jgi:molybdenum cofactor cytidylyltransferase